MSRVLREIHPVHFKEAEWKYMTIDFLSSVLFYNQTVEMFGSFFFN